MNLDPRIVQLFKNNIQGKTPPPSKHDGSTGHWLEKGFGIAPNSRNKADIYGWELKTDARSKTTFGDWSPTKSVFKKGGSISRSEFLRIFGAPNPLKDNRYSWSGRPVPNVKTWNGFGQKLIVDSSNNIHAMYSWSRDLRPNKHAIVPKAFQAEGVVLATWDAAALAKKVNKKFNAKGWFVCLRDTTGAFVEIGVGAPFGFSVFIAGVKSGDIYFDSGMYDGNSRPYSNWRANNSVFWHPRIVTRIK